MREAAGGIEHVGQPIERDGSLERALESDHRLGPATERRLVAGPEGECTVVGLSRLCRPARAHHDPADGGMRQRPIRCDGRGLAIGGDRRVEPAAKRGDVASSEGVLVCLVE